MRTEPEGLLKWRITPSMVVHGFVPLSSYFVLLGLGGKPI